MYHFSHLKYNHSFIVNRMNNNDDGVTYSLMGSGGISLVLGGGSSSAVRLYTHTVTSGMGVLTYGRVWIKLVLLLLSLSPLTPLSLICLRILQSLLISIFNLHIKPPILIFFSFFLSFRVTSTDCRISEGVDGGVDVVGILKDRQFSHARLVEGRRGQVLARRTRPHRVVPPQDLCRGRWVTEGVWCNGERLIEQ